MLNKKQISACITMILTMSLAGCSQTQTEETASTVTTQSSTKQSNSSEEVTTTSPANTDGILDTTSLFTERDLLQTADTTDAAVITVTSNEDVHITDEGIYVLQGTAENMTVYVEAEDSAKVQLVLDGVSITNESVPCIEILTADKVFITTSSDSTLSVTGTFVTDGTNSLDAVIYSKEDLVLNGTAALTINSTDTGVDAKDDLKITGGTYVVTADTKAFDANDSIRIAGGTFTINAGTDGFHAENSDDDSLGYIYIADGEFNITVGDDGIHGTSIIQIDGGTFTIDAVEGIEATYIQINGGTFDISASDDGINAGQKSNSYAVTIEITGGDFTITMDQGDTDALDSNGNLMISGGTLNITAASAFDYDGTGTYTGGTLIVNGEQVTELTQSMGGRVPMQGGQGQWGGHGQKGF